MNNKIVIFAVMLLMQTAAATVFTPSLDYQASPRPGMAVAITLNYMTTEMSSNATMQFPGYPDETRLCSSNTCTMVFIRNAAAVYNATQSFSIAINDGNQTNATGVLQTQSKRASLFVNQANATQSMLINGTAYWTDGNAATFTPVTVKIGSMYNATLVTDAAGYYSTAWIVPLNITTANYSVTATPENSSIINSTMIPMMGRASLNMTVNPQFQTVNPVYPFAYSQFTITHINSTNSVKNVSTTLCLFNCTNATGINPTMNATVPINAMPGIYPVNATTVWINDDGTNGTAYASANVLVGTLSNFTYSYVLPNVTDYLAGNSYAFNVTATSLGNSPFTVSLGAAGDMKSSWITLPLPATLQPNETRNFTVNMTVPYDAVQKVYLETFSIMTSNGINTIPVNFSVKSPLYSIVLFNSSYVMETNPYQHVPFNISNIGLANSTTVTLSSECPANFVCTLNSNLIQLNTGETKAYDLTVYADGPQDTADYTVKIIAKDEGNRTAEKSVVVSVKAIATELTKAPIIVYAVYEPSFSDDIYYMAKDGLLTAVTDFSVEGMDSRAQRESNLSAWIVRLGNQSSGIGEVCDVSLIVDGIKYDLDTKTRSSQALVGNKSAKVYEIYHFNQIGECVLNLDYGNGKETISHIVLSGTPAPGKIEFTKAEVLQILNDSNEENKLSIEEQRKMEAYILIGIACVIIIVSVYKQKIMGFIYKDNKIHNELEKFATDIKVNSNGGKKDGNNGEYV